MNFLQVRRPSRRTVRINPMLLPSIVQKTFSYLHYNDLLTCRNVNKIWNDEATKKLLEDKVIVTLADWKGVERFSRSVKNHGKSSTQSYFNGIKLGSNLNLEDKTLQTILEKLALFTKYLVVNTKVGTPEWRVLLFDQFSHIKELHIHGPVPFQPIIVPELQEGKSSPLPSTSQNVYTKGHKLTELVHLTSLTFNLTNRKSEDIFVRRFLRDLFSIVPNLKSLVWIKEDPFANDFQKTMFDCLMIKLKPGTMGQLEVFQCPSLVCGTKELTDIAIRSFPLKHLHIQISPDVSAHYLESFMESHGDTLEVVKLDCSPGTHLNIMVSTPDSSLVNLREISLTEYKRSIGFVGHLPSLRKLTLTRTNIKRALLSIGWAFASKEHTELCKSLTELHVFNDYLSREQGNCTREIVLKLAHCFPNLKVIRLEGLDDSSIRHLLKSFPKLEELYAPVGTYTDKAFNSFVEEPVMTSGRKSPTRYNSSAFDASHLKCLRTLELESIGLGDKFITHGIITWRSVRNLSMKYARISFQTLSRILMEMELHELRLQYCTVLTDKVLEVKDDPVEMLHDKDMLYLNCNTIQRWRFSSFKMLFVQLP